MFDEDKVNIEGNNFLYLRFGCDSTKGFVIFFWELDMEHPYIVKGWWNDIEVQEELC